MFSSPSITPDSLDELPAKYSLPWVWFGFVFAAAFFVEGFVAIFLELDQIVARAVLILLSLSGWIYWLCCVSRFHTILREISRNHCSITNAEAVGKHFIPFYNLYWLFKWPATLTDYLDKRGRVKIVSGNVLGAILLLSFLTARFFDAGVGLIGVFAVGMYISAKLRSHLKSISPGELPPPPDPNWFGSPSATQAVETDPRARV